MEKLALINAKVYLEREKFAEAVYCEDGKIKLVGSSEEVKAAAGDAKIIDCGGKTVVPGFNDSHIHLMWVGISRSRVDIVGTKSIDDIVERAKKFAAEHPEVNKLGMQAIGWNEELFTEGEKRVPTRKDLDRISTEYPIVFSRACAHKCTGNTKALELAGYFKTDFEQVPGGKIEKGEDGYPNGVFCDSAQSKLYNIFGKFEEEDYVRMFTDAAQYALSKGVTSVQSNDTIPAIGEPKMVFNALKKVYENDLTPLRYNLQCYLPSPEVFAQEIKDGIFAYKSADPLQFKVGCVKLVRDGSLGSRTALLRTDYLDDPGNRGLEVFSLEKMDGYLKVADENNIQAVTHCIGDQAAEDCINCYEKVLRDGKNPLRHAIVHCQLTDKEMLNRIAKDGILVETQPIFLDCDIHAMETRASKELASTSYAFKTMIDLGIPTSYGTDSPVEDVNPFPGLYCAVTRQDKKGYPEGGWFANECVDIYQAVDAYTAESAYAEFNEDVKGRIKSGYLADFAVLSDDIFTIDPVKLLDVKADMTIVGGRVVFER